MVKDGLLPELDKGIAFQTRWSDTMSVSYTSMSALAVIASGAAYRSCRVGTLLAGCHLSRGINYLFRCREGPDVA